MTRESLGLLIVVLVLVAFGTVMVFSSSAITPYGSVEGGVLLRQLFAVLVGLAGYTIGKRVPYRIWKKYSLVLLLCAVALLLLVLIPGLGVKVNGARRWFQMYGKSFQPSELAKLSLLIFVAAYLSEYKRKPERMKYGVLPLGFAAALVMGLILIEPDFGTSVFLAFIVMVVVLLSGIELRQFMPLFVVLMILAGAYGVMRLDHIQHRIDAYLNPQGTLDGKGYQPHQSKIAIGSGGIFGEGLGASKQKLFYLPDDMTDFILSIVGEELGLVGMASVLGLFVMFVYFGMKICVRAGDFFACLLSFGIVFMVGLQAAANIAVVTASVPTKGIPLPFISFGGTSLLFTLMGVGILVNISNSGEGDTSEDTRILGLDWIHRLPVRLPGRGLTPAAE